MEPSQTDSLLNWPIGSVLRYLRSMTSPSQREELCRILELNILRKRKFIHRERYIATLIIKHNWYFLKKSVWMNKLIIQLMRMRETILVIYILAYIGDVDFEISFGGEVFTVLILASLMNLKTIAHYVLSKGANIKKQTMCALATALHFNAMYSKDLDLSQILIDSGADLEARDIKGMTPILRAIEARNLPLVQFYHLKGANLLAMDIRGRTALHLLFDITDRLVNKKLLKFLLKSNCDPNQACNFGHTPMHDLLVNKQQLNRIQFAKVLIRYGASVHARTFYIGNTILHLAAAYNPNLSLIKYFIAKGVETEIPNSAGSNFLDYLLMRDRRYAIELMKYLLFRVKMGYFEFGNQLLRTIHDDTEMSEIKKVCIDELTLLGEKIPESQLNCCYLDIFDLDQNFLTALCRNEDIKLAIGTFDEGKFVIYGKYIEKKFDEALDLYEADRMCTKILSPAGMTLYIMDITKSFWILCNVKRNSYNYIMIDCE